MTVCFLADLHVANHKRHGGPVKAGINRRCQHVLDAMSRAYARADELDAKAVVILGDLFDTTRPEPQIVAAVQQIMRKLPTYILMGNHDLVSTAPGDHCLGPLSPVATVVETPTWVMQQNNMQLLFIPFQPGPAVEWLPEVVKEAAPKRYHKDVPATLLLHLGLADDKTPVFMRGAHDAVPASMAADLCKQYGFTACFAGNWHSYKVLRKRPLVCQVGAAVPTGWDNEGLEGYGAMVLWDGKKMEVEWIPGPRFLKTHVDDDIVIPDDQQVYLQIIAASDQTGDALEMLKGAMDDGLVVAGEVVPDNTEARVAAKKAAMVARSADTLEEALASYVEEMTIPEGVTREEVLATVRKYLGAG